jgi:hypothetical protein
MVPLAQRSQALHRVLVALALLALVAGAPLLALAADEVKGAEEELKRAVNAADEPGVHKAIAKLREIGGRDAAKSMIGLAQKIPPGNETAYWALVNGAAGLNDDAGLDEVADVIMKQKSDPISRDLMFALCNNRTARVATVVYAAILEKGTDELKLMAADNLCGIERVEAVDVIIAVYKKEEKKKGELPKRLLAGLKWLTGADCGDAEAWDTWWKQTGRAKGLQGRERRETNTGTVVDEAGPGWEEVVGLEKLSPDKILVLEADCPKSAKRPGNDARACNYDDMGKLLEQMKIPHKVVKKSDFEAGKVALEKAMVLLLTCTQNNDHCVCPTCIPGGSSQGNRMVQCTGCDKHDTANHKLSGAAVKKIKEWVERGGYLFSEDWGLKDALEGAWPSITKQGKMMKEKTVSVSPARGKTSHPLLRGVFIDPAAKVAPAPEGEAGDGTVERNPGIPEGVKVQRRWKIDDDSPFIDVADRNAVTVLMESDQLAKEGSSAIAITFLPAMAGAQDTGLSGAGKSEKLRGGRVLHVLSHFGKQESKEDEFALQKMLLNFITEANRRQPGRKGAS